ncbi:MAG TPA: hypothetical protein DG754_10580 [Bacteroidales bacterium]|nr:hypothetical protein [Bacteroidales bacterium]
MKRNFLKLIAIGVLPFFIAVSCSKDDKNEPLTKQEAVEILEGSNQLMAQTMGEILQTEAMGALMTFANLYFPDERSTPNLVDVTEKLVLLTGQTTVEPILPSFTFTSKAEVEDTPFGNYGTYTWDLALQSWTYEANPDNELIFNFPSDGTQEENNAVLTLKDFNFMEMEGGGLLTGIKLSLLVDNVNVLSVDYALALNAEGLGDLSLTIDMKPFLLSADLNFTSNSTGLMLGMQNSMKKEGVTIQASNLQAQFGPLTLMDFINEDGEEDIEDEIMPLTVDGFVQMGEVKATLEMNLAEFFQGLSNLTDPADITTHADKYLKVKLYVYPAGNSIAYVRWSLVDGEPVPLLVFSNGDEESLSNYFPDILTDLLS